MLAVSVLLVAALLAAITRPTVAEESEARLETTPTSSPRTTTSTTSSPSTTALAVPANSGTAPRSTTTTETPTTEAPTTTAAPSPPSSGRCASLPKAGGGQWQCTLSEEFDGTALNSSIWSVQTTVKSGFHSGQECFVDHPDNVSVSDGTLKLTAQREPAPFTCARKNKPYTTQWTSGMVMTYGKWSQLYGRFEIRAKMPTAKAKGLQTALWMWPVDPFRYGPWPASGEIDIAEWYSNRPGYVIPYIHYLGGEATGATSWYCKVDPPEDWHSYTLEWSPQRLTILYDGAVCLSITPPVHPFHQPFTIALTQALGIGEKNLFDPATTPLPATTEIDYVRAWR